MTNLVGEDDTDVSDGECVTSGVAVGAAVGDVDATAAGVVDVGRPPLGRLVQHLTPRHHSLLTLVQHPAMDKLHQNTHTLPSLAPYPRTTPCKGRQITSEQSLLRGFMHHFSFNPAGDQGRKSAQMHLPLL